MKKDIELIKQYPPWRKEKKEEIKIGFLIFIIGLILMVPLTYLYLFIIEMSWIGRIILIILSNLIPGGMCWLGLTSFVGDLSESIMDSYRLRKYNIMLSITKKEGKRND